MTEVHLLLFPLKILILIVFTTNNHHNLHILSSLALFLFVKNTNVSFNVITLYGEYDNRKWLKCASIESDGISTWQVSDALDDFLSLQTFSTLLYISFSVWSLSNFSSASHNTTFFIRGVCHRTPSLLMLFNSFNPSRILTCPLLPADSYSLRIT